MQATYPKKTLACLMASTLTVAAFLSVDVGAHPQKVLADSQLSFIHPGMLYTKSDLDRMRMDVKDGKSPAIEEWNQMQANPLALLSYSPHFDTIVYRNAPSNSGNGDLQSSSSAALMDAIEWYVTQNQAYADKTIQILNGWSDHLTSIQGHDAQLAASLYGYKLLNAAEIMRYSNAGWSNADIDKFSSMMQNVFYSLTQNFGYVNGEWANGNWDAADILFNISYGVWSNNLNIYDQAVNYYKNGTGNGSVIHYIQDPDTGEVQESGRDQAHTQAGLGILSDVAQIGWEQRSIDQNGEDMYSYPNNSYRLLKGIEYTAKYNLGYSVPYTPIPGVGYTLADMSHGWSWMPGLTISAVARGQFRPIYQQFYNFYHNDIGLSDSSLVYTKQVVDRMSGFEPFYFDEPSYGGLLDDQNDSTNTVQAIRDSNEVVALQNTYADRHLKTGSLVNASDVSSPVIVNQTEPNLTDEYDLEYLGDSNHFALKSLSTGKYLTVTNDVYHTLAVEGTSVGPAQTFAIFDTGNGNSAIQSILTNHYVTLDQSTGHLMANSNGGGSWVPSDNARWSFLYPVDTPVSDSSLSTAITQFVHNQLIDNSGVATSLIEKLKHNDMTSFVNEINAQTTKHVDIAAALYLLLDAEYLIDDHGDSTESQ